MARIKHSREEKLEEVERRFVKSNSINGQVYGYSRITY